MNARPDWDEYYLNIAHAVSLRADCSRARHGAVIVDADHRPISFGYNGAPSGHPGCLEGACPRGQMSTEELGHLAGGYDDPESPGFCISVHAEMNAILLAGRRALRGATIYITGAPCHGCSKVIAASGIERVVHRNLDVHPDAAYRAGYMQGRRDAGHDVGQVFANWGVDEPKPLGMYAEAIAAALKEA